MHMLNFTSTKASEYAAIMIGKGEHTVRRWRADFMRNGSIPDSQRGIISAVEFSGRANLSTRRPLCLSGRIRTSKDGLI